MVKGQRDKDKGHIERKFYGTKLQSVNFPDLLISLGFSHRFSFWDTLILSLIVHVQNQRDYQKNERNQEERQRKKQVGPEF